MKIRLVDTHAHLNMPEFDADREAVIQRAAGAGVDTIITVGTDMSANRAAVALAASHEGIYAAVGFPPQDAGLMQPDDIPELTALARHPKIKAIGETGLDYYRMNSSRDVQLKVLQWHLEIAVASRLPVIIHSRRADRDMPSLLGRWAATLDKVKMPAPGVIHCFQSDADLAGRYLAMGFYIAFGAYTGYPSSHLADAIRLIPPDRLLVETDSPYLPPQNLRGKRNEPSYILQTAELLAGIRGESFASIAQHTTENACRLFRIGSS